jgi:endonuclease/exonuclease/phosphatase family metal-dependent hydrolase
MNIKILTYNIAYEVSENVTSKGVVKKCNTCIENIINFINLNHFDVVCFQETSKWNEIMEKTWLKSYDYFNVISEKDNLTTFWNSKLKNPKFMRGSQFSIGRPFLFIYFSKSKVCLINLHTGHELNEYKRLENLLNDREKDLFDDEDNTIVIIGDFNESLPDNVKILKRRFYGMHNLLTCCDKTLSGKDELYNESYDQIISTSKTSSIRLYKEASVLHSDHLPVSLEILI